MLKARQKLGKYRIQRRISSGAFADIYQALDTIEGVRVALKIPHPHLLTKEMLEDFRHEVRLMARLDHPNILPLKDARFIDSRFVLVFPLGERTLAERLLSRMAQRTALDYSCQMLDAVAHARLHRIIHCDVKPDNLILFPENRLRLTDFGIAKVARRTLQASGSGTVGYVAPEQAMGKPSFRSDVFSIGLIMFRMFSGHLPEWPFDWPPPGAQRLRSQVHPGLIQLLRKAIDPDPRRRFADAEQMRAAFGRLKSRALKPQAARNRRKRPASAAQDWQTVRRLQFQRQFGRALGTRFECRRCGGPVSEAMTACPWCGAARRVHPDDTGFPAQCPRCRRGLKLDWHYCPWCYGPGFEVTTSREYSDVRYEARCSNRACRRKLLMPFMRYCPWCHRKVRRRWKPPGARDTCPACGWGVFRSFWDYCPWCGKSLGKA